MYTAQLLGDRKDEKLRRRIVNVKFTSPEKEFDQEFQFTIETEVDVIKKTINQFLEELNFVPPTIDDLIPEADPIPTPPTALEIARTEWESNWGKLQKVDELITAQVLTGSEPQVTALRKKVKDDFKVTYLG